MRLERDVYIPTINAESELESERERVQLHRPRGENLNQGRTWGRRGEERLVGETFRRLGGRS